MAMVAERQPAKELEDDRGARILKSRAVFATRRPSPAWPATIDPGSTCRMQVTEAGFPKRA
jgi:hypothetical protein